MNQRTRSRYADEQSCERGPHGRPLAADRRHTLEERPVTPSAERRPPSRDLASRTTADPNPAGSRSSGSRKPDPRIIVAQRHRHVRPGSSLRSRGHDSTFPPEASDETTIAVPELEHDHASRVLPANHTASRAATVGERRSPHLDEALRSCSVPGTDSHPRARGGLLRSCCVTAASGGRSVLVPRARSAGRLGRERFGVDVRDGAPRCGVVTGSTSVSCVNRWRSDPGWGSTRRRSARSASGATTRCAWSPSGPPMTEMGRRSSRSTGACGWFPYAGE